MSPKKHLRIKMRRMKKLMSQRWYSVVTKQRAHELLEERNQEVPLEFSTTTNIHTEIYSISEELGMNEQETMEMWRQLKSDRFYSQRDYFLRPDKIRKDNKQTINRGSGNQGSLMDMVRFPKKSRKTAWKRFYKLFPQFKGMNIKKSGYQKPYYL